MNELFALVDVDGVEKEEEKEGSRRGGRKSGRRQRCGKKKRNKTRIERGRGE